MHLVRLTSQTPWLSLTRLKRALTPHMSRTGPNHLAAVAQRHKGASYAIASLGKDQNSKSELEFLLNVYRFQSIIKSNCKLNHRKLGTVCTAVKGTH